MKNLIPIVSFSAFCLASLEVYPQGTIVFNNLSNSNPSPTAAANGLVFLPNADFSLSLLNQDISFDLTAGPNAAFQQTIHEWLVSDGSARGIATGGGHFADPSGSIFTIPGVAPGGTAWVEIFVWAGNYPTALAAMQDGAPIGIVSFQNTTGGGAAPPASLVEMPALVLTPFIPEPSSLAIGLLGAVLLVLRGRKRGTRPINVM